MDEKSLFLLSLQKSTFPRNINKYFLSAKKILVYLKATFQVPRQIKEKLAKGNGRNKMISHTYFLFKVVMYTFCRKQMC